MNNKTIGTIALFGAPWLMIGVTTESLYKSLQDSWFTGLWGLLYMLPWMGSIAAMQRSKLTGNSYFGKAILWITLGTLTIANFSNIVQLVSAHNKPAYFFYIDLFWPISNLMMLVIGITVLAAKSLQGGKRFIPLIVGLWFPFAMAVLLLLGRTSTALFIGNIYSAIAWAMLALLVRNTPHKKEKTLTQNEMLFQPVLP